MVTGTRFVGVEKLFVDKKFENPQNRARMIKAIKIGDIITIPQRSVSPCLHHTLDNALVTGFRDSAIDGVIVELFTLRTWQGAPNWPINHTIRIPFSLLIWANSCFPYAPPASSSY